MKGFAMLGIGKVGWIEKEKPTPGPFDAIVRPLAVAPCTSDIHTVFEGAIGERHDMILGHEAVGEVVEVGSEVKDFKPGDRVIVPAITPSWRTLEVQRNYHQHSEGMLAGWKFSNIKDGVFGEFFHVNDADMNLAHLPEGISLEAAVMLTDMMTTGFHGAELAEIELGYSVAVLGIGAVGLMAVAGARLRGASRIIVVGSRPVCVEVAKEYGATDVVNYKNGPIDEQIIELTNGEGVDAAIIAGGDSDILASAVKITKPGGNISNINYFGSGEVLPVPRLEWGCGMAHKTIRGGLCPGGRLRMEKLANLVKYKRVDPSKLVTHVFHGFENIEKALMLMKDKPKDLIKPVVLID
ncbi:NADP-dependent isopropanol dehydrogenase [Fonticella tunisiensis]|uniref:Threonine dehydrogenase-like Zn-dependent dehydrogenase n=1 Tax=Fonticella tunisiensis TaxID=1096341 RepID=A0A4R7KTV8_9CLOT|nr:NADP-dependent isopropanol dehydrogenase [Fonticella tunisiensis]TDT61338.1 threonine dehydrogenase-like Zn-dependent dehydrogenase [Fonticella tunisiensis]